MAINNREPEGPAVLDHTIENFFGRVPLIKMEIKFMKMPSREK